MKKFLLLVLLLALALTACDALVSPTQAAVIEPTAVPATAEVIVVTVEVPVEVTAQPVEPSPMPAPTETQPPTPAPTETAPPEAAPTESAPAANVSSSGAIAVEASLGAGYFADITYSNDSFSLRCPPKEITFTATATDPYIVDVDIYYRIEDRQSKAISEWKNAGRMKATGNGAFTMTLSGEFVHPDLRKPLAWFDFQLIGLNKQGSAVGRTEKIVQLVTYTIDCQ